MTDYILIFHFMASFLIIFMMMGKTLKAPLTLIPLLVLIPLFGEIIIIAVHFHTSLGLDGRSKGEEIHTKTKYSNVDAGFFADETRDRVIPLEDALILNAGKERQEILKKAILTNRSGNNSYLREASMSQDPEIVHFATTALAQQQTHIETASEKYENSLKILEEDEMHAKECCELIKSLGLSDSIITPGQISDIVGYYGKLDFTILTSLSEGQPLSVLESFAAGRPSVTTDVGCCRDLLYGVEGDNFGLAGYIARPMDPHDIADKMLRLVNNPDDIRQFGENGRFLLVVMLTYATLASLFACGFISLPLTRYAADQMYILKNENIVPSMFGAMCLVFPVGSGIYVVFLALSDLTPDVISVNIGLFCELCGIWIANSYLTAIKNYKGVAISYVLAIIFSILTAVLMTHFIGVRLIVYLVAMFVGYGFQLLCDIWLLKDFFPEKVGKSFQFLNWMKKYYKLIIIGTCTNIGLFSHMMIMWHFDIGMHIHGEFFSAPPYDIPAFYSYFATLVTSVYFTTTAETEFYVRYERYYSALNYKANIKIVKDARDKMVSVLWTTTYHGAVIQLLTTIGMISFGLLLFESLQNGLTSLMKNYFICLSIGYGIYATANMLMLYSMYFADYNSVLLDSLIFALTTTGFTYLGIKYLPTSYYGVGFMVGCFLYFVLSFYKLRKYTRHLEYEVLCLKPFAYKKKKGENPDDDDE